MQANDKPTLRPNPNGNTAGYTEEQLKAVEQQIGQPVEHMVYTLREPEGDTPGLYCGAVLKMPSRQALETYLTLRDRFPLQAQEGLLRDMLVSGHYDAEVLENTQVFMGTYNVIQEMTAYRHAQLKKRTGTGA